MDYLPDSDKSTVSRRSSIDQYQDFVGVMHNGMFCPLVFDQLDGIVCGKVHKHKIMIHFGNWEGYHYPIKKCRYTKATVLIGQNIGGSVQLLPKQFGRGNCIRNNFYEEKHNQKGTLRGSDGSLVGLQSTKELTVGLDYVVADDELEPAD